MKHSELFYLWTSPYNTHTIVLLAIYSGMQWLPVICYTCFQTTSLPITSEQEEVTPIIPLNVTDDQGTLNTQNAAFPGRDDDRGESSLSGSSASYNFMESTGGESGSQMDDLMFALRTGVSYSQEELQPLCEDESQPDHQRGPSGSEHLALRRISIADTHL